jgi:hypothetical protein
VARKDSRTTSEEEDLVAPQEEAVQPEVHTSVEQKMQEVAQSVDHTTAASAQTLVHPFHSPSHHSRSRTDSSIPNCRSWHWRMSLPYRSY